MAPTSRQKDLKDFFMKTFKYFCLSSLFFSSMIYGSETLLNKVPFLSSDMTFINCDSTLRYLNVSVDKDFKSGPELFSGITPSDPGAPIAVLSDNTFYVCTFEYVLKFDNNFKIIDKISLEEFGLDKDIHFFFSQVEASTNYLWILVREIASQKDTYFVMQWNVEFPPSTAKSSPRFNRFCHWDIDKKQHILYIPTDKMIIYSFSENTTDFINLENYRYVDFDEERGLLLSDFPQKSNSNIKYYDLQSKKELLLPKGALGNWGKDGSVYYCKGSTDLFEYDLSRKQEHLLFSAINKKKFRKGLINISLDTKKRYLSFVYTRPMLWWEYWGLVLVDLERREYRMVPEDSIGTISCSWIDLIKQEQTTKEYRPKDLFSAISNGNKDKIQEVLSNEVDINCRNELGFPVLYLAVAIENFDMIQFLLENNADIDAQAFPSGRTALHSSIGRRKGEFTEFLLNKGANPNIKDNEKGTPLHEAVALNRIIEVKLLLKYDADRKIKNTEGKTPMDIAREMNRKEISLILGQKK